jgi:ABC-type oligopeptide transport system substrate-binding subunit
MNDPGIQRVLADASRATRVRDRAALYSRAQDLLAQFMPAVPVAHGKPIVVARRDVSGFTPSGVDNEDFTTVSAGR